jgi:ribonuclease PH
MPTNRTNGREPDELRPLSIETGAVPFAEGSALIKLGSTHVLCAATVEDRVPRWMAGRGTGWVTAEYSMLPRSTLQRSPREAVAGKQGGRTVEIQRLIGRSLRAVIDLRALGERQLIVDCDVLQADGGTRCAAITGGFVALSLAIAGLQTKKALRGNPMKAGVAAVSVGVVRETVLLDLDYDEDRGAEVDVNVVMTDRFGYVELQGTAEQAPFSATTLDALLSVAATGLGRLFEAQRAAIAGE